MKKNRKSNFREIVRKNQRYKLVSTEKMKRLNYCTGIGIGT